MCDYSLYGVASRPAKVGDKLVSTKFTISGGFAAVGEPNVAVCLLPGTEVAFEKEVEFECISGRYPNWKAETKLGEKVARFRQLHKNEPHKHHDALEFADGQIVLASATLADFSRARDSQITFSVTHGWSAFWRGRPWLAERRIGETSLAVGSSRFWIGWVTRHGDKCARST